MVLTLSHFSLGLLFAILGLLTLTLQLTVLLVLFSVLLLVVGFSSILTGYGFLRFRFWLTRGGVLTSIGYLVAGVLMILSTGVLVALGAIAITQATATLIYLRTPDFRTLLSH